METTAIAPASTTLRTEQKSGLEGLGGDDFFKLLIAQLSNQDPLEPTSNQELLNQISSIRDIQSSITLTSTLESLVERQGFGSAASLIGQYVSGVTDATDGSSVPMRGIVMGLRITPEGSVMLLLDNGLELPMNKVEEVTTAQQFAEMLQG
ncbi:MAG: hypothetical protein KAV82_04345, partial [Phycisphaerae bacterium]|nr:hypothetical protein [Phycisphaerae bacterium]